MAVSLIENLLYGMAYFVELARQLMVRKHQTSYLKVLSVCHASETAVSGAVWRLYSIFHIYDIDLAFGFPQMLT